MPKQKYQYFTPDTDTFSDDILNRTSVYVKFPEENSTNETIILSGPYHFISLGNFSSVYYN